MTLQEWATTWDDLDHPQICSVVDNFTDIKADVEKLCSFGNVCTYDQKAQVNAISAKLDTVIAKAKRAR